MPEEFGHDAKADEPFLEINTSEEEGSGQSTLIFIISIILVVLVTGFLVFYKYKTDSQAADKQQALNNVLDQLHSTENKTIETKASDLNSSLRIITIASRSKYSFNGFINELVKKITNDTKLNSMSISDTGLVTMDGVSASYRSVADLAVALKSSAKLNNIEITGLNRGLEQGSSQVTFSMTAQITDWKADSSAATSGGTSE